MRDAPTIRMLPDGRRLHLNDGPIDLIVWAEGSREGVQRAYDAAAERFTTVLDELCAELTLLRSRAGGRSLKPDGVVARRMADAVAPYSVKCFITPMAAVAGAVAEEILQVMTSTADLSRAYVNDGGDIALHLAETGCIRIGMVERPDRPSLFGAVEIPSSNPARGVATSGWRGRSFSLGIADAVTVLADRAAQADAAATVIANAVDLQGHPGVMRIPACEIAPDSDLGNLPVTRGVQELLPPEIDQALQLGAKLAEELLARGLVRAAALRLQGRTRVVPEDRIWNAIELTQGSLAHA
jgi:uncharacterized protein